MFSKVIPFALVIAVASAAPALQVRLTEPLQYNQTAEVLGRKCHYDDPFQTACQADEVNITVHGVPGSFCTPKCDANNKCHTDVCPGTVATPTCNLQDAYGGRYCTLVCNPKAKKTSCSSDEHMTCQAFQGTGICTYYS